MEPQVAFACTDMTDVDCGLDACGFISMLNLKKNYEELDVWLSC